jgi:hypothetical protein
MKFTNEKGNVADIGIAGGPTGDTCVCASYNNSIEVKKLTSCSQSTAWKIAGLVEIMPGAVPPKATDPGSSVFKLTAARIAGNEVGLGFCPSTISPLLTATVYP